MMPACHQCGSRVCDRVHHAPTRRNPPGAVGYVILIVTVTLLAILASWLVGAH